jgi:hypothetical protein
VVLVCYSLSTTGRYEAALGLVPVVPKTRERLLLLQAQALHKTGRTIRALAAVERCIAESPNSTKAW